MRLSEHGQALSLLDTGSTALLGFRRTPEAVSGQTGQTKQKDPFELVA